MDKKEVCYYVSACGRDDWSGTRPTPGVDADGPFATIERARLAARRIDRASVCAIRILVSGGTYYLEQPLRLESVDSGTRDCPVSYEAWGDEPPVISAGVEVRGWEQTCHNGKRAWIAPAPGHAFHNLWVNGSRRFRPRYPREGLLRTVGKSPGDFYEGTREFCIGTENMRSFSRQDDVEFVYFAVWTESRLPIETMDRETGILKTRLRSAMNACDVACSSQYYYDNVFEELNEEGQWYLDRAQNLLYYLPYQEEALENTRVVVPTLENVMQIAGTKEHPVEYVSFHGLIFQHTQWWRTDTTPIFRWDIRTLFPVSQRDIRVVNIADDKAADHQAAISCEAALNMEYVAHCALVDCEISNTGSYGVSLGIGCRYNHIKRCRIYGHGGGGIKIGTQQLAGENAAGCNIVSDCDIHDCAEVYHSAVGIWIGQSAFNHIAHNAIHDMSYSGISVGWTWGYGPSDAFCNLIEYNLVYNIAVNGWMHDLAGIYMLGVSPGTIVRNNIIRNVGKDNNVIGIYTDEGSSYIRWENNIVDRVDSAYLHHFGKNNIIVNNIFMHYNTGLVRGKEESPETSLFVERNIFISDREKALLDWQPSGGIILRNNLYWCPKGVQFSDMDFTAWQAAGNDDNSLVADPCFVSMDDGTYRLEPDSPAYSLGFVPIDTASVGPRPGRGAADV